MRQDARAAVYDILPEGPDLVIEAAGPIEAVRLMVILLRRGTRWNVFGITTRTASRWSRFTKRWKSWATPIATR